MTDRIETWALNALVARGNIDPDRAINQGTLDAAAAAPVLAAEVLKLRAEREAMRALLLEGVEFVSFEADMHKADVIIAGEWSTDPEDAMTIEDIHQYEDWIARVGSVIQPTAQEGEQ